MKKLRALFLAFVLVASMFLLVACSKVDRIDVSNATTSFEFGEEFVFDGTVTFLLSNDETRVAKQNEYTVDSSLYNANVAGTYQITVAYSRNEGYYTKYDVTVKPKSTPA